MPQTRFTPSNLPTTPVVQSLRARRCHTIPIVQQPQMPAGVVPIRSGTSGRAKDQKSLRNSFFGRPATIAAATRTKPCIVKKDPSPGQEQRNRLIRERRAAGGKKAWKQASGYHRRSLVETHMFRLKTILGGELHNINISNQKTEAAIMASILNKMTALGMPETLSFVK